VVSFVHIPDAKCIPVFPQGDFGSGSPGLHARSRFSYEFVISSISCLACLEIVFGATVFHAIDNKLAMIEVISDRIDDSVDRCWASHY
jgi:hypothetical protein